MAYDYREINAKKRFCNSTIIERVAEECNTTEETVKFISSSLGRFAKESIERGDFKSITLPNLGKLLANRRAVVKARENGAKV